MTNIDFCQLNTIYVGPPNNRVFHHAHVHNVIICYNIIVYFSLDDLGICTPTPDLLKTTVARLGFNNDQQFNTSRHYIIQQYYCVIIIIFLSINRSIHSFLISRDFEHTK